MERDALEARWHALIEEVVSGMRDWRTAHPRATFREIEAAINERLDRLRARMLEEAALASRATDLAGLARAERPACPECGQPLEARGQHERTVRPAAIGGRRPGHSCGASCAGRVLSDDGSARP